MPIQILPADVVDKISAGEVLERPANLIKELVENSLDSGADEIEVEFANAGQTVVVRDNGSGIPADQLKTSLARHATSKITDSDDLFRLHTFGFRGEALASIAAVSRLTMTSRTPDSAEGSRVISDFGQLSEVESISARPGTEVRVEQLFGNVPARLRFLKSEAAEHTQIRTTLKALALANAGVTFRVKSKGELIFHWPKSASVAPRALEITQAQKLYHGSLEMDGASADVWVSSPEHTLNVNKGVWLFVQGRWVQDRSLTAAVMEAYRNLLMHGEYPVALVRLTLPPAEVDVNVHPTKAQVKFRDSQMAFRLTCRAIRQVLEQAPWLEAGASQPSRFPSNAIAEANQVSLRFAEPELNRTQFSEKIFPLAAVREAVRAYLPPAPIDHTPAPKAFSWRELQVIGQVHQTYIVAQSDDHFYMVDQHAAHERIMFERLSSSFKSGHMDVQSLLLPLVLDLTEVEVEALHAQREAIARLGIQCERMGPESLAIQATPLLISESAVTEALRKLADQIVSMGDGGAIEQMVGEIFATMACHSAIRAGQTLSLEQSKALLEQMDEHPLSSFCPHGRPVFIKRRFVDIEKEFGRIV
jgi:DNA mismatch repair protein MutL